MNAVLPGRRNNPPDPKAGHPALAVYNPIHYQELPELFMEFICQPDGQIAFHYRIRQRGRADQRARSMRCWPVVDLNNALVSMILTGYGGFTTSAGYVGPNYPGRSRRQHAGAGDLVPHEGRGARPAVPDRKTGFLEKLEDFEHQRPEVLASRLGYRITDEFASISWAASSKLRTLCSPRIC